MNEKRGEQLGGACIFPTTAALCQIFNIFVSWMYRIEAKS